MTSRQFLWGLSNGVSVLAIAGTFWFGAGLGPATWRIGPELWTVFLAILLTSCCGDSSRSSSASTKISLVVSLHFAPLGYVFHGRAYYVTALAGALVSFVALVGMSSNQLVFLGSGMALVMWSSAWYLVRNADQIAARAVEERWV